MTLIQEEAIELLRDIAEENVMYIGRVSKKSEESLENFEKTNIEDAKEIFSRLMKYQKTLPEDFDYKAELERARDEKYAGIGGH